MSPFQPAVRAYPEKRHPDLDVDIRDHLVAPLPGAGRPYNPFDDLDGPTLLTTVIPVLPTTFIFDAPASDIGDTPTPTTVVLDSTSIVIVVTSEGPSLPASALNSTLPAVTNTSDIIPSSSTSLSPLPPSSLPVLTTTDTASRPTTTSPVNQGPVFASTSVPPSPMTPPPDSVLTSSGSGTKKSQGLSGGAIAAIVIVLLLALCAAAFFVFRNRRIQKRMARRVTWTATLSQSPNFDSLEKGPNHVHPTFPHEPTGTIEQSPTDQGSAEGEVQAPVRTIARKPPLPYSPAPLTLPLQSYNNPPHVAVPYVPPATASTQGSTWVQNVPMLVRVTFVPQLPDELAITPGETLYIQTEYDDGWALCANTRGKQGMVPMECLEGEGGQLTAPSHVGSWRTSRRASSLRSVATWS